MSLPTKILDTDVNIHSIAAAGSLKKTVKISDQIKLVEVDGANLCTTEMVAIAESIEGLPLKTGSLYESYEFSIDVSKPGVYHHYLYAYTYGGATIIVDVHSVTCGLERLTLPKH